jgi:hypothetical protein
MSMKLAVYSSRTRGFDGRIFVVRTVNSTHKLAGDQLMQPDELEARCCRKEKKCNGEVAER